MMSLFTIMRAQGNHRNINFEIVDFVDHAILLVDAARPSLLVNKMLQVFHLSSTCTRMFLKFNEHVGNLLDGSLIPVFLIAASSTFDCSERSTT